MERKQVAEIKKPTFSGRCRLWFLLAGLGCLALLAACSDSGMEDDIRQNLSATESERDAANAQRDDLQRDLGSAQEESEDLRGSLQSATAERDGLRADLESAQGERDALQDESDELRAMLDSVIAERDGLSSSNEEADNRVADLEAELRNAQDDLGGARASLAEAESRVQELLTKYDEEIRADLRAEADAEIARACAEAVERYKEDVSASVKWNDSWAPVTASAELTAAVEECAGPGRANAADVDAEIERACGAAAERYDAPVAASVEWKSAWSSVMSREDLEAAVEECAGPQRSRSIELRAEADAEIERACGAAVERYNAPVESSVRWNNSWSPVTTEEGLVADVAQCAERGRANAAAVETEIERACGAAVERYRTAVSSLIRWRSAYSSVMSRDEMTAAVEDCAEPERSQAAERAEFLDNCERISVDQIEKNPDGLRGECFQTYAYIVQFDSATGSCSFHAEISRNRSTRWYDYDVRSAFGYGSDWISSAFRTDCPELDNVDNNDYVKVWGTVQGTHSYESTAGWDVTVPLFKIEKVELVRKD